MTEQQEPRRRQPDEPMGQPGGEPVAGRPAADRPAGEGPTAPIDPAAIDPAAVDRAAIDRTPIERAPIERAAGARAVTPADSRDERAASGDRGGRPAGAAEPGDGPTVVTGPGDGGRTAVTAPTGAEPPVTRESDDEPTVVVASRQGRPAVDRPAPGGDDEPTVITPPRPADGEATTRLSPAADAGDRLRNRAGAADPDGPTTRLTGAPPLSAVPPAPGDATPPAGATTPAPATPATAPPRGPSAAEPPAEPAAVSADRPAAGHAAEPTAVSAAGAAAERAARHPDGPAADNADRPAGSPDVVTTGPGPDSQSGSAAQPPWKRLSSAGALIWVLLLLFGFTLVVQLRNNDSDEGLASARQEDLVRILSDLDARDTRLQAEIAALETSQRQLTSGVAGREAYLAEAEKRAGELGLLAGTLPGRGPGLEIRISGVKASALLNTVQELRGAGGEVMELVGASGGSVRIVASSYFVDDGSGGVVADGTRLGGPYTLWVIGPVQTMRPALEIPGGVVASVKSGGGSVTMEQHAAVEVATVRKASSLQYARPVS